MLINVRVDHTDPIYPIHVDTNFDFGDLLDNLELRNLNDTLRNNITKASGITLPYPHSYTPLDEGDTVDVELSLASRNLKSHLVRTKLASLAGFDPPTQPSLEDSVRVPLFAVEVLNASPLNDERKYVLKSAERKGMMAIPTHWKREGVIAVCNALGLLDSNIYTRTPRYKMYDCADIAGGLLIIEERGRWETPVLRLLPTPDHLLVDLKAQWPGLDTPFEKPEVTPPTPTTVSPPVTNDMQDMADAALGHMIHVD